MIYFLRAWGIGIFLSSSCLGNLAIASPLPNPLPDFISDRPAKPATLADAQRLFAANQFTKARDAYQSAIRNAPKQVGPRLELIRTLMRLDDWQGAEREGAKAVALTPQNADAHGLYALALMRGGRPGTAGIEAGKALALDKKSYWGLVASGRVLVWDGKKADAQKALKEAAESAPQKPEAWHYLLDTFEEGKDEEFFKALRVYVGLQPHGYPYDDVLETLSGTLEAARNSGSEEIFRAEKGPLTAARKRSQEGKGNEKGAGAERALTMTFPIERDKDDIVLPLRINGERYRMLFDTGAGESIALGRDSASRLNLHVLGDSVVRGVSGKETTHLTKADSLEIGSQTYRNVPLEFIDNNIGATDGLLGGAVFQDYAVTVNFEDNLMTLTQGKGMGAPTPLPGDHVISLPFHLYGGYIFIPIQIEGKETWGLLDTGAQVTTLLSLGLARDLAAQRPESTSKEIEIDQRLGVGISSTTFTALVFRFGVEVGLLNGNHTVYFNEVDPIYGASMMDSQVSRSYDFQLGAIVGIHYLARARSVTFDYPHQKLTLEFRDTAAQ